jgi:hypothetical protein
LPHALPPKTAGVPVNVQILGNPGIRQSVGLHQNDAASQDDLLGRPVVFNPPFKGAAFLRLEIECRSSWHALIY